MNGSREKGSGFLLGMEAGKQEAEIPGGMEAVSRNLLGNRSSKTGSRIPLRNESREQESSGEWEQPNREHNSSEEWKHGARNRIHLGMEAGKLVE